MGQVEVANNLLLYAAVLPSSLRAHFGTLVCPLSANGAGFEAESAFCLQPIVNAMGYGRPTAACCREAFSLATSTRLDSAGEQSLEHEIAKNGKCSLRAHEKLISKKRANRKSILTER